MVVFSIVKGFKCFPSIYLKKKNPLSLQELNCIFTVSSSLSTNFLEKCPTGWSSSSAQRYPWHCMVFSKGECFSHLLHLYNLGSMAFWFKLPLGKIIYFTTVSCRLYSTGFSRGSITAAFKRWHGQLWCKTRRQRHWSVKKISHSEFHNHHDRDREEAASP